MTFVQAFSCRKFEIASQSIRDAMLSPTLCELGQSGHGGRFSVLVEPQCIIKMVV